MSSRTSASERADAVLSRYGLRVRRVRRLAGGNMTDVRLVEAEEGRFVLRRLRPDAEPQARTRHHLLRYQEERLEGVPVPVASLDGETLAHDGGAPYELLRYVPGRVPRTPDEYDFEDDALLASAGSCLGRLHRALAAYVPPQGAAWFRTYPETLDWDAVARRLQADPRPEAAEVLDLLDDFAVRVERLSRWPYGPQLPLGLGPDAGHGADRRQVIHNDFGWYNAVLRRRRVVGVIDFDCARPGHPIEDVAWAALTFVPVDAGRSVERVAERLGLLMDTYEREAPLRPEERAAVPWAIARRLAQMPMAVLLAALEGDSIFDGVFSHAPSYVRSLRRYEDQGVAARLAAALT